MLIKEKRAERARDRFGSILCQASIERSQPAIAIGTPRLRKDVDDAGARAPDDRLPRPPTWIPISSSRSRVGPFAA